MNAVLTIDDCPTPNTLAYLDFLLARGIQPALFIWGELAQTCRASAIGAIQRGVPLGNHSYTHPRFSSISYKAAVDEIERCEALLDGLYSEAGVRRPGRLFRFPYGDQGGENRSKLSQYLRSRGFVCLAPARGAFIADAGGQERERDVRWSLDVAEYRMPHDSSLTLANVAEELSRKIEQKKNEPETQLILIHDHPQNERQNPGYFYTLVEHMLAKGIAFEAPLLV